MYLKSLELHGFKSFPNRTVLTFERGATVIVGPNGSGKSNISDAMRWVLGELSSRNIRGTKMEDVIFGGTDDRRPMGFAEVSVTFDNTDPVNRLDSEFDEVTVTRRYYRTGESEYLINKEAKRLRDIHMLFMNTGVGREGYSIIGQGKVSEIVSKKSDERRSIFEEAAGISKYRYRKEEAERKLKGVSENLERINDIKVEIEAQVATLEKDAEKARRGLEIFERKKRADVSLWLYDTKQIRADIEDAERLWMLSKHELEVLEQLISDLEAQTENLYEKSQTNKIKSAELLEQIRETTEKIHDLENALRSADSDFAHSAELIAGCRARIAEIEKSEAAVNSTKAGYLEKVSVVDAGLAELSDERFGVLTEQQELSNKIDGLKKSIEDALLDMESEERAATDLKIRIDILKHAMSADGEKSVEIEKEIARYDAEGELLRAEADKCEDNASVFKKQIAAKDAILSETSEKIEALTEERSDIQTQYNDTKLEHDALVRRADDLQRMVEHFDGYAESIKFVMREYSAGRISNAGEIYGPLSSLINVDKRYITAIETALGASLQNIVVDNEATAKAAIYSLKRANAGRATFYPVSAMRPSGETDEIRTAKGCRGFVGRADTLVGSDERYRSIIEFLLLRTLVFDDIENASSAAKKANYRVKIVTLDGQVINAGGSFTGGSAKRDSGILSRTSEITALREKSQKLDVKLSEYTKALTEIEGELAEANNSFKSAEQEKEVLLTLSRTQFAALDNANAKYAANRSIVEKFREDYDNLINQKFKAEEEVVSLAEDYKAACERAESIRTKRSTMSIELSELDDALAAVMSRVNEVSIKIAEKNKEKESFGELVASADARLSELALEKSAQVDKIEEFNRRRSGITTMKSEHKVMHEQLERELDRLQNERREVESGSDEFERELHEIRQKTKDKNASMQVTLESTLKNENELTRLRERQDRLGSQLWDDYEITYEDAVALNYPTVTAETRDEVAAEQSSCRSKLRSIGNFDPDSIEKYAETKTRYDYYNTQYVDLTKSQEELMGIIERIESEMRTSFVTAFNDINKHFGITFKELFGGGNAELSLTDPEDVLTSGIEIKAAPPGKIIKSMSLLSGGEQSFVAIALLFAILKVNPTPFCILDEIEAALDEVNVYRFGEYVRKLGEDTQFILITHRRGTMEVGDRLYGVTMPQRGISQAIELNVNEIEGKQKELLDGVL